MTNVKRTPAQDFEQAIQSYQHGRFDQAKAACKALLAKEADHVECLRMLSAIHYQQGEFFEALGYAKTALTIEPDNFALLSGLGVIQAKLGHAAEALAIYDKMLALQPTHAETITNRGTALMDLKRFDEALQNYDKALALIPYHPGLHYDRGNALGQLNRSSEALASFDMALALKPDYVEALNGRGIALLVLQRPKEALASFERAAILNPDYAEAVFNKGNVLAELGQLEAARGAYEAVVKLGPGTPRYYHGLSGCKRFSSGDPHLGAMEELAQDMPSFVKDEQISLHFSLSKAYADIKEDERSFEHLLNGNALKRSQIAYDEAARLNLLTRMRGAFTSELMQRKEGVGDPSATPVFILGMPRSGSTLIEQILASHPKVFGADEINDLGKAIVAVSGTDTALNSPELLAQLSDEQLRRLGADYVKRIRLLDPAAERITNKTPTNFQLAGLIHLALPNARIIHTKRDAMDTCLSCFSKLFVGDNLPFTYDLGELGRFYKAYESLMAHWRGVLPAGAMLEVQYEDVVEDLEGQARRILDFCGLEWDERCLDFYKTERQVRTASMAQVRQPLFKSSVGRWRAYEQHLGPLLEALGLPRPAESPEERS